MRTLIHRSSALRASTDVYGARILRMPACCLSRYVCAERPTCPTCPTCPTRPTRQRTRPVPAPLADAFLSPGEGSRWRCAGDCKPLGDLCIIPHLRRHFRDSGLVMCVSTLPSPSLSAPCIWGILQSPCRKSGAFSAKDHFAKVFIGLFFPYLCRNQRIDRV